MAGAQAGMFQTPGVQNLLSQVSSNPQLFENMMQSPYMQEMMNQMIRNPDLVNSVWLFNFPLPCKNNISQSIGRYVYELLGYFILHI